ncbi:MAG: efflux RND transporter periplasmic adaptor subunit [Planctomycetota bacterium]
MKAVKVFVTFLALAAAIAGAGFGAMKLYESRQAAAEKNQTAPETRTEPPTVRVTTVATGTLEQRVFVTGTIEPDASARVTPETSGVLETFRLADGTPVEEGLEVNQGDRLGVIEHEDLKAALDEAKANLRVADASLREARVQLGDARTEKNRMLALHKEGTVTDRQRDKAVTAFDSAQARVDLAKERVGQARATLHKVRLRYQDATIQAPISGVVSEKYVGEGSYVNPSTPLAKIIDIEHVEARGAAAGKYFPLLQPGRTKAGIHVDAYPEHPFSGVVDRVQPELDPVTRTVRITIRVANRDGKLKPGMFARMEVLIRRRENVTVVPDAALVSTGDGHHAFVVNDGKVQVRAVRIGMEQADRNEVLEGLSPGETVVVQGHQLVEEGMAVRTKGAGEE